MNLKHSHRHYNFSTINKKKTVQTVFAILEKIVMVITDVVEFVLTQRGL